jgi:hypothetical protein
MSDELTISVELAGTPAAYGEDPPKRSLRGIKASLVAASDGNYTRVRQNFPIANTQMEIVIGSATPAGYVLAHNPHATAVARIRNGSTGADVVQLDPGGVALFKAYIGATLYAIADLADVDLDFLIFEA